MLRRWNQAAIALAALSGFGGLLGCNNPLPGPSPEESDPPPHEMPVGCPETPPCDPDIHVDPNGPALLINDPVVLARVPLERVVKQIVDLDNSSDVPIEPIEVMQRLFDTMN